MVLYRSPGYADNTYPRRTMADAVDNVDADDYVYQAVINCNRSAAACADTFACP